MPIFRYKAKTAAGAILSDLMEADSSKAVSGYLQDKGYFPITIAEEKKYKQKFTLYRNRVKAGDLVVFTRQVTDLLKGGLPLVRALDLCYKQTENTKLKEIIKNVRTELQQGTSYSAALSKYPEVFSPLYTGLIKAGESGGSLEISMERVAKYLEQNQEFLGKMKTAMTYPLAMFTIGVITVIFLLMFVIPKFSLLFSDVEEILPLPTRILITASSLVKHWWWFYLPALGIGAAWYKRYLRTPKGEYRYDRFILRVPVLGRIIINEMVIRFTRTLGLLLQNGVPMVNALEMTKKAVGNKVVTAEIDRIYEEIKTGKGLVEPLSQSKVFPAVLSDLVAAGQEVGSLENSLLKIADTYEGQVENALKAATSLVEPIVIVGMGLLVGFIVLAMLLPIFEISGTIK